ncbi:hypothetical protein GCM10011376_13980 [Nocardioides flavus (ex Wang et al. 2016)]|uniref:Uncharacterized protein n=1 Tax=Nocardioides flavus (ex Wang et al. 2016) TaxID=2058780 RepID=A0ABQ3HIR5_9ACTN|nr:hypothetical protein [Nocardioides flavus (ex Wang et al. 2016)]GHE16788.1 hypothetical protein GCM10011376_13980 [Nocardioides flavus (ex Wang et al. 2016)]
MEILLWLVPSAVVTAAAMAWVSWASRDGRGEVDRDVAAQRLGRALAKDLPAGTRRTSAPARDRSTGIAVRPSHSAPASRGTTRRAG